MPALGRQFSREIVESRETVERRLKDEALPLAAAPGSLGPRRSREPLNKRLGVGRVVSFGKLFKMLKPIVME